MIIKPQMRTIGKFAKYSEEQIKKELMFHKAEKDFVNERCGPIVKEFINDLPWESWANWIIDVRLHFLEKGDRPAIDAWHLDFYSEVNSLNFENRMVVIGNCSLPEFVTSEIEVDKIEQASFLTDAIFDSRPIKEGEKIAFTATDYHRAMPATKNGYRLFMRATNCSHIELENEMPEVSLIYNDGSMKGSEHKKICYPI